MAAYVFHKRHGENLQLSSDAQTVSRKDRSSGKDGIALTSKPLGVGKVFEVMLTEISERFPKFGIEIGVTMNNPDTLDFPTTMTDCKENITYMLSGNDLVRNKKKMELLNSSTYELKVGETLGVCLLDGGKVEFRVNKSIVTTVETKYLGDIWGVVDLYSHASQACIYTGKALQTKKRTSRVVSMPEGEINGIMKVMVEKMARKSEDYETAQAGMDAAYQCAKTAKQKEHMIAGLIQYGGAKVMTEYISFLKTSDNPKAKGTYVLVQRLLIPMVDSSKDFCLELGKAGFLQICVQEIKLVGTKQSDDKLQQTLIGNSIILIHNMARTPDNVQILRRLHFVEVAQCCVDKRKYKEDFVVTAVMAISYVMEENEASLARLAPETCETVLSWLKKAISEEDHLYHGWHAEELCSGFANLAADFENLKNVVSRSGHILFARLLLYGNAQEKEAAVRALHAHTCPQSYKLISSVPRMLSVIKAATEDGTEAGKALAAETLEQLEGYVAKTQKEKTSEKAKSSDISQSTTEREVLRKLLAALSMSSGGCVYSRLCKDFIKSLKLSSSYFSTELDRCSCEDCRTSRGDEKYSHRGDPPQKHTMAEDWCRFGLNLPPRAVALQVHRKWHKAFHGTKQEFLEKILSIGELAKPGSEVLGGDQIYQRSVHIGGDIKVEMSKQIYLSPSIHYAGGDAYATPKEYTSPTGEKYTARVAFETFIAPDSYSVGKQTIGASGQIDPEISNDEIEWKTDQMGSTILYGLLIKLTPR